MHDQTGCFDPNTTGESVPSLKDNFPQTLPPSSPMVVVGNTTTNSINNSLEENLRLSVEELSCNHHNPQHQQDHVSTYASGVTATSIEIPLPQHLGLNMGNSYINNNNNMDNHLVQEVIDAFPYQQSTWDPTIVQELQDMAYANHTEQTQQQQQNKIIEHGT